LGDAEFVARHERLAAYLGDADEVMRFELACRVAALLEQYVTYRPDWLQAWHQGHSAELGTGDRRDEAWQAALWQRIDAELDMHARHPAQAFVAALQRGGGEAARRAGLPDSAHVFALPSMPQPHMRLLQQLGACVELHVYVLNPCREYWFELIDRRRLSHLAARGLAQGYEEGNRLLAAWGRQTQVLVESLVDLCGDGAQDDAHFEPAAGDSLLARVQNAMLDLQEVGPGSVTLAGADRSIELHVCHSLTRELEVLQDHLLGLFAARPGLRPCDILVVTPDLDSATPLIDALFGTAPKERAMPYAIIGRARSGANLAARALLSLLALAASRCTASALFGVLQQPLVARRFGLDDEALAQVHDWLRDAGFHWALDARHLASFGLPPQPRHTLNDALQRLFLGYALPSQLREPFDGLLGCGDVEGSRAAALGAFWRFADGLQQLHQDLQRPKLPDAWEAVLFGVLDDFLQAAADDLDELRELHDAIRLIADDMRGGGVAQPLPLDVVRAALQQQLDAPARGGAAGGGITFASMSSLRGLPFAVVCAIGLNDGAFPSTQRPLEFDLMALFPRRGDRQRRSDERGLMLDLVLAARHSLYLSHTGRSARDNTPLPPSVLVAELLDLLLPAIATDPTSAASLAQARRRLVIEHPLQPFAAEAFAIDADPRLRSFNRELAEALRGSLEAPLAASAPPLDVPDREEAASQSEGDAGNDEPAESDTSGAATLRLPFFRGPLPAPEAAWRQVSLDQLVEFFRNPCRYLLRRRMGVALSRAADELQDDEPFLPDARARNALARRLMPAMLQGADDRALQRLARAGTEMPQGAIGEQQMRRELQTLQDFAARVRVASEEPCLPPHALDLDFELDGEAWQLRAGFADLRASGLLRWHYGERRAGDYLEAWLHHLALCADTPVGVMARTRWLRTDGEFHLLPCAMALPRLRELLVLYRRGLCEPLRFFPRAAWQYVQHGRSQAQAAWLTTRDRAFGEDADPAYRLALRGIAEPLDADFEAHATAVFGPLLQHLDEART
jgi:exodeoxyribonuclease V gamma subunit